MSQSPAASDKLTEQLGQFPQTHTRDGVINLGLGQPSPRLLPLAVIREAAARRFGPGTDPLQLQYGAIAGYEGFREALASWLTGGYQFPVSPSRLAITGGISSALSLVAQLFTPPGGTVVCSDPTYFLARGVFESQGLMTVGIPVDAQGMDVEHLEHKLVAREVDPSIVYCMPSFHNPCGVTLDPGRAEHLVQLAERFDFLIVADEPYVLLHAGTKPPPCMMSYDGGRGRVLSLGSFSKILAPGLRLGWIHAEPPLIERFCGHGVLRSGGGLNPVVASIVHGVVANGDLATNVEGLRSAFAIREATLTAEVRRHLPDAEFNLPAGGYFVWLKLPEGCRATELAQRGEEFGVAFTPGPRCAVQRNLEGYIRLCFAFYEPRELALGAQRLAKLIQIQAAAAR